MTSLFDFSLVTGSYPPKADLEGVGGESGSALEATPITLGVLAFISWGFSRGLFLSLGGLTLFVSPKSNGFLSPPSSSEFVFNANSLSPPTRIKYLLLLICYKYKQNIV